MLTMLTLGAIWCAMHESRKRSGWLAAASLAYGLAVGARPSLLFGAVILLVPVAQAWRERRTVLASLLAATVPLVLIGLGLMLYNALRFDSPFEFGIRYQLAGDRELTRQFFSLRYLWFNFRVYFLEPARWSGRFPFVHDIRVPPLPAGHAEVVEHAFGVLTNIPLVWLALAVPLAWRGRSGQAWSVLRWFVMAVALLLGICALTIGLFWSAAIRYEAEFLPALVLLAVVGLLGLERAVACKPVWRRMARSGWGLLLGFSVAFNLLASVKQSAEWHSDLGVVLARQGKAQEAVDHFEQALRFKPDYAEAHNNLGAALFQAGQVQEAIDHYEQAVRLAPDFVDAHLNLGLALMGQGKAQEAIDHYEQAVRLKPDYAEAHNKLGTALMEQGRMQEAIGHYEQALRINPDYVEAHNNLGIVLMGQGRLQEAIGHYEQALRIQPDYVQAQCNWGNALLQTGKVQEAIGHYEAALRIKPDMAEAHYNLGVTLEKLGRTPEAIQHYEQALRIKPDFVQAQNALARARAVP
jgi:tetratricopeptide (TPR) repeat protein